MEKEIRGEMLAKRRVQFGLEVRLRFEPFVSLGLALLHKHVSFRGTRRIRRKNVLSPCSTAIF